jgi:hypothetical protein
MVLLGTMSFQRTLWKLGWSIRKRLRDYPETGIDFVLIEFPHVTIVMLSMTDSAISLAEVSGSGISIDST